jgi:uncharacterized protein YkwD
MATLLPASVLSAPADSATSPQTAYANEAFTATNSNRTTRNLASLTQSSCLKRFAASQAQKMADQSKIFHQPLGPIAKRCRLRAVGENVAYGFPSGSAVVRGWMNSSGHRANILNRSYRQMAVAARQNSEGTWYVAQVFGRRL